MVGAEYNYNYTWFLYISQDKSTLQNHAAWGFLLPRFDSGGNNNYEAQNVICNTYVRSNVQFSWNNLRVG